MAEGQATLAKEKNFKASRETAKQQLPIDPQQLKTKKGKNKNAVLRKSKSTTELMKNPKENATLLHSQSFCENTSPKSISSQWSILENDGEIANQTDQRSANISDSLDSIDARLTGENKAEQTISISSATTVKTDSVTTPTSISKSGDGITTQTAISKSGDGTTPTTTSKSGDGVTTPATTSKSGDGVTTPAITSKSGDGVTIPTTISKSANCVTTPPTISKSDDCVTKPTTISKSAYCVTTPPTISKSDDRVTKPPTISKSADCVTTPPTTGISKSDDCVTTPTSIVTTTSRTCTNAPNTTNYITDNQNDQTNISVVLQKQQFKQQDKLQRETTMYNDHPIPIQGKPMSFHSPSPTLFSKSQQNIWQEKCKNIEAFHGDTLSSNEETDDEHEHYTTSSIEAVSQDGNKSCSTDSRAESSSPVAHSDQQIIAHSTKQSSITVLSPVSTASLQTVSPEKPPPPPSSQLSSSSPSVPTSLSVSLPSSSVSSSPNEPLTFFISTSSISSVTTPITTTTTTPITTTTTQAAANARSKPVRRSALQVSITDATSSREHTSHLNDLGSLGRQSDRAESLTDNLSPPEVDCSMFPTTSSRNSSTLSSMSSTETSEQSTMFSNNVRLSSIPTATISPNCRSDSSLPREGRRDIVLLHAEADTDLAQTCRDHLTEDIGRGIHNFTADLFSEIDSGRTAMRSLEKLHDKYIYILVLGTQNLAEDNFAMFLHENILTKGLKDGNGKEDRVIPIWVTNDCRNLIMEFSIIKGFEYYYFLSDPTSRCAKRYIEFVQRTVNKGRKKFK